MSTLEKWQNENKAHSTEGNRGVQNICKLARAIGYKDPTYFGQLGRDCYIGDLINFFEDNPGAIQAVVEWVGDQDDHVEKLEETLEDSEEDLEDD